MTNVSSNGTTTLYLVRHGATPSNEQRPYVLQGRGIDLSLSETGDRQAAAVGKFFRDVTLHHVYSSGMARAVETAKHIATPHRLEPMPIDELAEVDVGRWEGMAWETIMRDYPEEYRRFMDNPAEHAYLEGESYGDVLERVRPVLTDLLDRHAGESIAVVAHNVVNRVYLAWLLGLELRKAKDIRQGNACVNVIERKASSPVLRTMNACFHLDGI